MNALQSQKVFKEADVIATLTITRIPALAKAPPRNDGVLQLGSSMVRVERLSVELELVTSSGRIYSAMHADAGTRELLLTLFGLALEHQSELVKQMHAWLLDQVKVNTVPATAGALS